MTGALMNTYARFPVEFERGEGATLWDAEGNAYLDFLAAGYAEELPLLAPEALAALRQALAELPQLPGITPLMAPLAGPFPS